MDTLYAEVGGAPFFRRLVDLFYDGVAADVLLRPLYPEQDLGPARQRLFLFLSQYWGGPGTYSETRGHPRLRMRHAGWQIGIPERDAWLEHMRSALGQLAVAEPQRAAIWAHLEHAATSLLNTPSAR